MFIAKSVHSTLDKVFRIKGAGGHDIPYLGIVEAAIRCPKVDMVSVPVVLLVVPDTEYHSRVPVLLGTNILSLIKGKVPAEDFAWRNTFAMLARHQAVVENASCLGVMTSTKPLPFQLMVVSSFMVRPGSRLFVKS